MTSIWVLHTAMIVCCRPVPASWYQPGAFRALTDLDLNGCQLTGTLPTSWPPMLQFLDVSSNYFSGMLSPGTSWPSLLQTFDMSYNFLSGALPVGLASLKQLQQLALSNNSFSGVLGFPWCFRAVVLPGNFLDKCHRRHAC